MTHPKPRAAPPLLAFEEAMLKTAVLTLAVSMAGLGPALAVNTWAGNTAEDMAQEQRVCSYDAYRFCGGNTVFIFEMENCLKRHLPYLTKVCRQQLTPTDFRKYHRKWPHPF